MAVKVIGLEARVSGAWCGCIGACSSQKAPQEKSGIGFLQQHPPVRCGNGSHPRSALLGASDLVRSDIKSV
jgi:hypothetical protein